MPSALLVEDDVVVCNLHEIVLRNSGFTTKVAKSGDEAVEMATSDNNFDVIFMKHRVPILDGGLATMLMRSLGVKCLIVGLRSFEDGTTEEDKQDFIRCGLDECFEIPLNSEKISKIFNLLSNVGYLGIIDSLETCRLTN